MKKRDPKEEIDVSEMPMNAKMDVTIEQNTSEMGWNILQRVLAGDISRILSKSERFDLVKILFQSGEFSVKALTPSSQTLLHLLCLRPFNDPKCDSDENNRLREDDKTCRVAQALLKYGVNFNHRDENGKTALMLACENELTSVVVALVLSKSRELDIDAVDSSGETALTMTARNKNAFLFNYLIDNIFVQKVQTSSVKAVKTFLDSSSYAFARSFEMMCLEPIVNQFQLKLLTADSEIPLGSCISFVTWLIAVDKSKRYEDKIIYDLLFEFDKLVCEVSRHGKTALHLAMLACQRSKFASREIKLFEILLESGRSDINALTYQLETVLHFACRFPFIDTSQSRSLEEYLSVLQRFGTITTDPLSGYFILYLNDNLPSSGTSDDKVDEDFMNLFRGADLDASTNMFVFHMGRRSDKHECNDLEKIIRQILSHKVNVNQRNSSGKTALMVACESGNTDAVRELLKWNEANDYELDLDVRDNDDQSALSIAKQSSNEEITEMIKRGLFLAAAKKGDTEIVKLYLNLNEASKPEWEVLYSRSETRLFNKVGKSSDGRNVEFYSISNNSISYSDWMEAVWTAYSKSHSVFLNHFLNDDRFICGLVEDGETLLHMAIKEYLTALSEECKHQEFENKKSKYFDTGEPKSLEKIIILLTCKCDANANNSHGETVLHLYCNVPLKSHEIFEPQYYDSYYFRNLRRLLEILLEHGIDVNWRNIYGQTALMVACEKQQSMIVEELLNTSRKKRIYLDIKAIDNSGQTAFMIAKRMGDLESVRLLRGERFLRSVENENKHAVKSFLDKVANKRFEESLRAIYRNEKGEKKEIPIKESTWICAVHIAHGKSSEDILNLLLDYHDVVYFEPQGEARYGDCILNWFLLIKHIDDDSEARLRRDFKLRFIRILLESDKIDVNAINAKAETPLHLHLNTFEDTGLNDHDSAEITTLFLSHGANVNQKDENGNTPLAIASDRMCTTSLRAILNWAKETGTWLDLDAKDQRGQTPLIKAVVWKNSDAVEMLLNAGASVNVSDDRGFTALHHAFLQKAPRESCDNFGDFPKNCGDAKKTIDLLMSLYQIDCSISPEEYKRNKFTTSLPVIFNYAKETGILLDLGDKDQSCQTAAAWKDSKAVEMLLDAGASVNVPDDHGFTVLHHAFFEKASPESCVKFGVFPKNYEDLKKKIDLCITLFQIDEPAEQCERNGTKPNKDKIKIVELLLSREDIDVNALDCEGYSPLDIAEATIPEIPSSVEDALRQRGAILNVFQKEYQVSAVNGGLDSGCDTLLVQKVKCIFLTKYNQVTKNPFWQNKSIQTQMASARDQKRRTAWHCAVIYGETDTYFLEFVKKSPIWEDLMSHGCSINAIDIYGRNPLHYTSDSECESLLLSFGADPTIIDVYGMSASERTKLLQKLSRRADSLNIMDFIEIAKRRIDSAHLLRPDEKLINRHSNSTIEWCEHMNPQTIPEIIWALSKYAFNHPSVDEIRNEVTEFMQELVDQIKTKDPRFEVRLFLVGSSRDGTRFGLPDEFDFTCVLTKISQVCEVSASPELPTGFVQIKRKQLNAEDAKSSNETVFDSFFDNGILITEKINTIFKILLYNVLTDTWFIQKQRNFDWNFNLENNWQNYSESLAFTLELKKMNLNPDIESPVQEISIDIVPCIHIDGWWPDEGISNVSDAIRADGCILVFDQRQKEYPWVPYSKSCAKISFAIAECDMIKMSSDEAKKAYMIGKQLIKNTNYHSRGYKPGYILKNSFLHCIEAFTPTSEMASELGLSENALKSKFNQINFHLWLESLMKCYLDFVQHDFCPCYFMPKFCLPVEFPLKSNHNKIDKFDMSAEHRRAFFIYLCISPNFSEENLNILLNSLFERFDRRARILDLSSSVLRNSNRESVDFRNPQFCNFFCRSEIGRLIEEHALTPGHVSIFNETCRSFQGFRYCIGRQVNITDKINRIVSATQFKPTCCRY